MFYRSNISNIYKNVALSVEKNQLTEYIELEYCICVERNSWKREH